ncbi:hypothetical protein L7F22_005341 [Adiantum nelumboides]|nr:hypothetical protein [Adiantum nelumboides]
MPPKRKNTPATHELRPDDSTSSVEHSHGGRPNRGKRGGGKVNNNLGTGGVEHEQVEEAQQGKKATIKSQASSRRQSNVPMLGQSTTVSLNTASEAAQSSLKVGGLNSTTVHSHSTLMATQLELKQDQALSSRTSCRPRKVVCYNEQSPSQISNKVPPTASKSKTKAAAKREPSTSFLSIDVERIKEDPTSSVVETLVPPTASKRKAKGAAKKEQSVVAKRDDPTSSMVETLVPPTASKPQAAAKRKSSALLLSVDAKRVMEGPTSSMLETLALRSDITSLVKRRRTREQEVKLLQSHVDKDSAVSTTATNSHVKRGGTRAQGLEPLQRYVDEKSAAEKILFLQTRNKPPKEQIGDPAKLEALEGKTSVTVSKQKKKSNREATTNAKGKKRVSKRVIGTPQDQEVIEDSTGLESRKMAVAVGNAQDLPTTEAVSGKSIQFHRLINGSKDQISSVKEIRSRTRQTPMANGTQNAEVCLPDAFDDEPKEVCEIIASSDADRKSYFKAQKKGRKPVLLKRALPGAQAGKEDNFDGFVIDHDLLLECKSVGKGGVEDLVSVDKNIQSHTSKRGRKTVARMKTFSGVKGAEMENASVIDNAKIPGCHDLKIDLKSPEKSGVEVFTKEDKILRCRTRAKERKPVTRKETLPATRGDDMETATVLGIPSVLKNKDYATTTDTKLKEVCSIFKSCLEDNNLVETQLKEKNTISKKRTLQGAYVEEEQHLEMPLNQVRPILQAENAYGATAMNGTAQTKGRSFKQRTRIGGTELNKKLKASDSLPSSSPEASLQNLVEKQEDAENQQHKKAIKGVDDEEWTATDLTNLGSRVEGLSEKKKKEEGKRKRAMKFDALPVGFGLGISCWSPSPLKCEGLEELTGLSEVGDSVVDNEVLTMSLGGAEKQPNLQEVAMLDDTRHILSSKQDLKAQPNNVKAILISETALQKSSKSQDDVRYAQGSGLGSTSDKIVKFHGGKVGGRTRKTGTTQEASSQSVARSIGENMLEEEKMVAGSYGINCNMQPNFCRGAAIRSKRITRSTKQ